MRLISLAPPAVEPLTLDEAKLHLRVDFADDDDLIASLIVAARRYLESASKQALISQQWRLMLDSFPSAGGYYNRAIREIWPSLGGLPSGLGFYPGLIPNSTGVIDIPKPPLISLDAVSYWDFSNTLQTLATDRYNVSLGTPARIQPAYSKVWPISRPTIDSVQIDFTCGWGTDATAVPDTYKSAMRLLIGAWYMNREAEAGVVTTRLKLGVDALIGADEHGAYA